jgi:cytochrome c oxidase cbb3-type subunit 3
MLFWVFKTDKKGIPGNQPYTTRLTTLNIYCMFLNRFLNGVMKKMYKTILLLPALMFVQQLMAENGEPPRESSLNDPIVLTMVIVMLILLLAIILLGNVVVGTASYFLQKEKEKEKKENASKATITATCIAALLMLSAPIFAQDTEALATLPKKPISFGSLSPTAFYAMAGVLVAELVVIFALLISCGYSWLRKIRENQRRS